jgi:four helix bundle protein
LAKEDGLKTNPVREKSFSFALEVIELHQAMVKGREYIISKQVLKAGTGIGANIEEALAASSRKDFRAKMAIASREARECHYWLRLTLEAKLAPAESVTRLLDSCGELVNLLTAIVKTAGSTDQASR